MNYLSKLLSSLKKKLSVKESYHVKGRVRIFETDHNTVSSSQIIKESGLSVKDRLNLMKVKRDKVQSVLNSFVEEAERESGVKIRLIEDAKYGQRFTVGMNVDMKEFAAVGVKVSSGSVYGFNEKRSDSVIVSSDEKEIESEMVHRPVATFVQSVGKLNAND